MDRLPAISSWCRSMRRAATTKRTANRASATVPIDPCQGVIAALRTARGERIATQFIDLETPRFVAVTDTFPDPYALKQRVNPERFAAAMLAWIRARRPARSLVVSAGWRRDSARCLEIRHSLILFVCSILDWPWIRDAYSQRLDPPEPETFFSPIQSFPVDPRTLIFTLGEIPYITALYERGQRSSTPDDNLSVDGVKEMVLDARERLRAEHPRIAQRITPQSLSVYFRYIRNLSLMDRRLTPDLYTLVIAAQQTAGDDFALALAQTAREYPFALRGGFGRIRACCAWGSTRRMCRSGVPARWSAASGPVADLADLRAQAETAESTRRNGDRSGTRSGCAHGPRRTTGSRDFHRHVRDQAKAIIGADLAHTEKFTTSVRDGIDIRETLRNWHTGTSTSRSCRRAGARSRPSYSCSTSRLTQRYTNRTTWYAEHAEESTLAFYATDP